MNRLFLLLLLMGLSSPLLAQKVDNKKGVTYIDDKPVFKLIGGSLVVDNDPVQVHSYQSDKMAFVVIKHTYTVTRLNDTWCTEIRFADFDFSFFSTLDYKPLLKSMYNNGVFNDAGEVSRENAEKYKRLFGFTPPPSPY